MTAAFTPDVPEGDLFRCDYCGQYRPLSAAELYWTVDRIDGDRTIFTTAVYCSAYCGRHSSDMRIGN